MLRSLPFLLAFATWVLALGGCASGYHDAIAVHPVESPHAKHTSSKTTPVMIHIRAPEIVENGAVVPITATFAPALTSDDEVEISVGAGKVAYTAQAGGEATIQWFSGRVRNRDGTITVTLKRSGKPIASRRVRIAGPRFEDTPTGESSFPSCKARGRGHEVKLLCTNRMGRTGYIDNIDIKVPHGRIRVALTPNASENPYVGVSGAFDGAHARVLPSVATTAYAPPRNADRRPPNSRVAPKKRHVAVRQGTCFVIAPNGYIATNQHVVAGADSISLRLSDGKTYTAHVAVSSESTDLAVLRVDAKELPYLSTAPGRGIEVGDPVFTIGYPLSYVLGEEPKFTSGVISAKSGLRGEPTTYQTTVPIQPGNSGGPLVNMKGQVIGVMTSTAASMAFLKDSGSLPQNVNWAVKSDYLLPLVETRPVERTAKTRRDAIAWTEEAVCMVTASSVEE